MCAIDFSIYNYLELCVLFFWAFFITPKYIFTLEATLKTQETQKVQKPKDLKTI